MLMPGTEFYDILNACLNVGGAVAISSSIYRVWRDKLVRGIHWGMLIFFISWSTWNLFLYLHLGLWFSFIAGILMVLTEGAYLSLLLYFSRQEQNDKDAYNQYLNSLVKPNSHATIKAKVYDKGQGDFLS